MMVATIRRQPLRHGDQSLHSKRDLPSPSRSGPSLLSAADHQSVRPSSYELNNSRPSAPSSAEHETVTPSY
ncbi:unnamed protein product [Linum trigynum]|uniref:Uncharacterized protein n=1 Tax=Linum trigynum TaxID=586398 RepID=A0AAV2E344_9ROSI